MFAAKNLLLTPPTAQAAIAFDAVTVTGFSGTAGTTASLAFTATTGADVFLVVSIDGGSVTLSNVKYGANNMTQLVSTNYAGGGGTMMLYRLAGGGTGSSQNLTFNNSGGIINIFAVGFSYKNVNSASTTTASGTGGSTGSQSMTISAGQMAVALLIGEYAFGGVTAWTTISGGTGRTNQVDSSNNNVIAVRDSTSSTTFSASETGGVTSGGWGAIKLTLS